MEILKTLLDNLLISFVFAAVLGPIIIWILYNRGILDLHKLMRNRVNEEFIKAHQKKSGTPTMGGFIIIIPVIVLTLLLIPNEPWRNVFLAGLGMFAVYGFFDKIIIKTNIKNTKFLLFQESFIWRIGKLILLYLIGTVSALLIRRYLGIESLSIGGWFSIPFGGAFVLLWGAVITATTYSTDITDGLDGLVTGLFLIAYSTLLVIAIMSGHLYLVPLIGFVLGACLVYLYFNITPARVFMGAVGDQPLGFGLIFIAILTNSILPFLLLMGVMWVEALSSALQIFSIRFFKKKIFKIAPIHHHFEAVGWTEAKIVQRFWLAGIISAVVALWVFIVLR